MPDLPRAIALKEFARRVLPAQVQDVARQLVDLVVPARREVIKARRKTPSLPGPLISKLSPDGRVLAGPFAGMWMPWQGSWGGEAARLAGSYEEELNPYILRIVSAEPRAVIDLGAAEGYYAVGLARLMPSIPVLAYEIDPGARRVCREVTARNGVKNVKVRGRITPSELRRHVRPHSFVLSDVEGYEGELLDPAKVPMLREVFMLIELHEFAVPGVTRSILERFSTSHAIDLVDAVPRWGAGRAQLAHLTNAEADQVVQEGRPTDPPMQWAVIWPYHTRSRRPTP
jgi:hypothetical protein